MEESANVLRFAEARASEIASLMEDINFKKNKAAFQRLPPHMRRRAASHNPKRVPRKLRDSYLVQNPHASAKPKKAPKKQRKRQQKKKHEKQSTNYPEEYASRSRPDSMWLGTHMWHAKRCKMENVWGYKLPIHCNDRKLGATHQAATKHAMLLDLSYYCCISLKGPEELLCNTLSQLTDPKAVSHFSSEMYLDGSKEGHAFLYHSNSFPHQAIGPVTFNWKPVSTDNVDPKDPRKLWMWCHPTFHNELVDVIVGIFHVEELFNKNVSDSLTDKNEDVHCKKTDDSEEQIAFASKVNFEKTKMHFKKEKIYSRDNVQMTLLKDKLVRHRLIGPNAQSVITNVLGLANIGGVTLPTTDTLSSAPKVSNCKSLESLLDSNSLSNNDCKITVNFNGNAKDNSCSISKKKKLSPAIEMSDKTSAPKESGCNLEINSDAKVANSVINGIYERGIKSAESSSVVDSQDNELNESIEGPPMKKIKLNDLEDANEFKCSTAERELWWQSYFRSEAAKASHSKRGKLLDFLRNGRSNYFIPPGSVVGLTVRDPRLILSMEKRKFAAVESCFDASQDIEDLFSPDTADSPLWEEDIRNEVTATQISENEINKERAKYVIPSESLNLGNRESRVPILLIHQSGTNGFGSGWDLIAPLGWSMAFWIPLVLNGGRATGLRDLHFFNMEMGQPTFPLTYPDTKAGATYEEKLRVEELTNYYRRPKAKRPNFSTFGILHPFHMPWEVLVKDWLQDLTSGDGNLLFTTELSSSKLDIVHDNDDGKGFFVLRPKEIRQVQLLCERVSKMPKSSDAAAIRALENMKQTYNNLVLSTLGSEKLFAKSLVLIRTKCLCRGTPSRHSGVYLLNDCDINEMKSTPNFLGPKEPNHALRKNAQVIKDKCSSIVEKSEESSDNKVESSPEQQEKDSKNKSNKSSPNQIDPKDLERPVIQSLISCSSRKMIGYLTEGGFSNIMGKGCGIGHCSFLGLLCMLKSCIDAQLQPLVLIREQHSFQYRVSSVEIIPNYL